MADLVALDLPAGPAFVEALQRVWEAGDAALPIDQRLPAPAHRAVFEALQPTAVIDGDGRRHSLDGGRPAEPGDALVLATSGTTGAAKGVILTAEAVAASATATSTRLGVDPAHDHWLACLPPAHVGGLSVITRALLSGTALTVLPGFDAVAVAAAARRGATLVSLVPTALRRIDPALFRAIVLGGSAPPQQLPANVHTTYGMTETGSGVVYDGVALDGVEVRTDPAGQILLRGPMLLRAYRDGQNPRDGDGWLPTGDAGAIGGDGRLIVHGRLGDLIITGGENVWPDPVEAALRRHPLVADAAVVPRPDPEWGQRVVAVVELTGTEAPTLDALRALVKEELPAFAAPRQLEVVASLPRTALGKVRRAALRAGPPA